MHWKLRNVTEMHGKTLKSKTRKALASWVSRISVAKTLVLPKATERGSAVPAQMQGSSEKGRAQSQDCRIARAP